MIQGIFLRTRIKGKTYKCRRTPCSPDGEPKQMHDSITTSYGWKGHVYVSCPFHEACQNIYIASEIMPYYLIHTYCEAHYSILYPKHYAKAKDLRDDPSDPPVSYLPRFRTARFHSETVLYPWTSRDVRSRVPKKKRTRKTPRRRALHTFGKDIWSFVSSQTRRRRYVPRTSLEVVLYYSRRRYIKRRKYTVPKIHRT